MHPRVERAWAHERVGCDEVVEPVAAQLRRTIGRQRRLELEHPAGAPAAEHPIRRVVVERKRIEIDARPLCARLNRRDRVGQHRQRRQAEEVHLEHAGLLQRVHVVLRDDDRLVVRSLA